MKLIFVKTFRKVLLGLALTVAVSPVYTGLKTADRPTTNVHGGHNLFIADSGVETHGTKKPA